MGRWLEKGEKVMKYQIVEQLLNEYVDAPVSRVLEEIEASSIEEAQKIANQRHPNSVVKAQSASE